MAPARCYFDASGTFDLDAYGLIVHLRKAHAVVAPEVTEGIPDRDLRRRLASTGADGGARKRTVPVSGVNSLDPGEIAIIETMACERGRGWRRTCVSKDAASRKFIGAHREDVCEVQMDTSDFITVLYKDGIANSDDVRRILSHRTRPPNKRRGKRLGQALRRDADDP